MTGRFQRQDQSLTRLVASARSRLGALRFELFLRWCIQAVSVAAAMDGEGFRLDDLYASDVILVDRSPVRRMADFQDQFTRLLVRVARESSVDRAASRYADIRAALNTELFDHRKGM